MNRQGRPQYLLVLGSLAIVFLLCAASGCASNEAGTTATLSISPATTDATASSTAAEPAAPSTTLSPSAFRNPFIEHSYLKAQPVDLSKVTNLSRATLSAAQKEVLARQSFVAVISPADEQPWKFWQVYESARYRGIPLLVTTDSVLNTYHGLFDTLLQRMEERALFDQAVSMTEALYAAASDQWNTATDADCQGGCPPQYGLFRRGQFPAQGGKRRARCGR